MPENNKAKRKIYPSLPNIFPDIYLITYLFLKMIKTQIVFLLFLLLSGMALGTPQFSNPVFPNDSIPAILKGKFVDDYGIRYTITPKVWTQHKGTKYHILSWNIKEQYIIAKNDKNNPSGGGLFTRIDYMLYENMKPFNWGFCLTVYDANSQTEAEQKAIADRSNPKKGCGGFPFSRMKRKGF